MQSENTKFQGDKFQSATSESTTWKAQLENRPVDWDNEKKQGDPLLASLPNVPLEEPRLAEKSAREFPEYHQGELKAPLMQESLPIIDATATIETAKEMLSEAKEVAQEKASELYQSASHQAETLVDQAYKSEKILEEKAGGILSAAYSAVSAAASVAIEKGKDGLHYLGKEVYELSDSMAEKANVTIEKAAHTAQYLNEKKDEVLKMAAESAQAAIESVSEPIVQPVDYGTTTGELSDEGFKMLQRDIKTFERSASFHLEQQLHEQEEPQSEAASTLQMIADEAKPVTRSRSDSASEFMQLEEKEAEQLRNMQQKAITEEKAIQREKQFVRRLSEDLTESLRRDHVAFEKHEVLDGASPSEMKPLLRSEPRSQATI